MSKTLPLFAAAALLTLAAPSTTPTAEAGADWGTNAGCNGDKFGAGRCWGTLRNFRQSSDPNAYARFHTTYAPSGVTRTFGARFNGRDYGCTIIPWLMSDDLYKEITGNPDLYFVIRWGTDFACVVEQVSADSGHLD